MLHGPHLDKVHGFENIFYYSLSRQVLHKGSKPRKICPRLWLLSGSDVPLPVYRKDLWSRTSKFVERRHSWPSSRHHKYIHLSQQQHMSVFQRCLIFWIKRQCKIKVWNKIMYMLKRYWKNQTLQFRKKTLAAPAFQLRLFLISQILRKIQK